MNYKIDKKYISLLFYSLVIIFFAYYLRNIDFHKIVDVKINLLYYIPAAVVSLLGRFYSSFIWTQILKYFGAEQVNYLELNQVFSKAALGRYVPGKVAWIVGRVVFATKYGISKTKLAVSSVFEGALKVIAGFVVGGTLLLFSRDIAVTVPNEIFIIIGGCTLVGVVFLSPAVFNSCLSQTYKLIKKKDLPISGLVTWNTIIKTFILFTLVLIINGYVIYLFILSIHPDLALKSLLYIIGVANVAASIGIASIIAPSGIGVKEGVQIVLLSIILPKEVVLVSVILIRLSSILVDFLFFGFSSLILRVSTKKL